MIEIDGSFGEGGGQILRYALALSAITKRQLRIYNIRAGRKKPGLMPQHLTCVRAVAELSNGKVIGDRYGSKEIIFHPGEIRSGSYRFDVAQERGSAGSVTLVLQSVVPIVVSARCASELTIKGGTHVPFAPIFDYWKSIFGEMLRALGVEINGVINKYGFYPKGGGEVVVRINSSKPKPFQCLNRGKLLKISATSAVANLPTTIAERQLKPVIERFSALDTEVKEVPSVSSGTYVFLKAEYENTLAGFTALGKKGKPAEKVGSECVNDFLDYHNSPAGVDPYLSDQILIYLLMASGKSNFVPALITKHLRTGIWVINQFLGDVVISNDGIIEIDGVL